MSVVTILKEPLPQFEAAVFVILEKVDILCLCLSKDERPFAMITDAPAE